MSVSIREFNKIILESVQELYEDLANLITHYMGNIMCSEYLKNNICQNSKCTFIHPHFVNIVRGFEVHSCTYDKINFAIYINKLDVYPPLENENNHHYFSEDNLVETENTSPVVVNNNNNFPKYAHYSEIYAVHYNKMYPHVIDLNYDYIFSENIVVRHVGVCCRCGELYKILA